MKTNLIVILCIVVGILSYTTLLNRNKIKAQREEIGILKLNTDTVYRSKVIKVPKPYEVVLPPTMVIFYTDTGNIKYNTMRLYQNHIALIDNKLNDSLMIHKHFLTRFPLSEKLISFELKERSLNLQLLSLSGITKEKKYNLDLQRFNYRYVNNELSRNRRVRFQIIPEVEYSYRMLNQLHDLNMSLNLKTKNFNYVMGVSGFHYPQFQKTGYDARLMIRYNFR
jgi:hypothetical protein